MQGQRHELRPKLSTGHKIMSTNLEHGHKLEFCWQYGVDLDAKLCWNKHVNQTTTSMETLRALCTGGPGEQNEFDWIG